MPICGRGLPPGARHRELDLGASAAPGRRLYPSTTHASKTHVGKDAAECPVVTPLSREKSGPVLLRLDDGFIKDLRPQEIFVRVRVGHGGPASPDPTDHDVTPPEGKNPR